VSKDIREIVQQNASYQLPLPEVQIDIGKTDHRVVLGGDRRTVAEPPPAQSGSTTGTTSGESRAAGDGTGTPAKTPEVSHLGWGHWLVLTNMDSNHFLILLFFFVMGRVANLTNFTAVIFKNNNIINYILILNIM
jgi:hypothetical protein